MQVCSCRWPIDRLILGRTMTTRTVAARGAVSSRLRNLAGLELVNIALIAWAVFWALELPVTVPNVVGYGLTATHLAIGAGYWMAKGRQLREGRPHLPMLGLFRFLRAASLGALLVGAVGVGLWFVRQPDSTTVPGVMLVALAVAEHVNYFHRQLMHDTGADLRRLWRTRRLHRSHLNVDLRRPPH
jgi:hypothetical protein